MFASAQLPIRGRWWILAPCSIRSGMSEIAARYSPPTRVSLVRMSLMCSALGFPERMPGMKPPYLRMLSATSLGLKMIET